MVSGFAETISRRQEKSGSAFKFLTKIILTVKVFAAH